MSELPVGWAETDLSAVTSVFSSTDPRKRPRTQFTYVDIGSIDNSTQTIKEPKTFLGQDAPSRARRIIRTGDVLFSTVRTYLKNIADVPPELDGKLTSTGIAVLRPNAAIESRYLFNWVCSDDFIAKISASQDGTLYPAVTDNDVKCAPVPLPPLAEQRRIVAKVDGLTARTARARKELDRIPTLIARYKQRLLALAFSGELTASWRKERNLAGPKLKAFQDVIDEGPTNGWSPPSLANSAGALSLKLTATTSGKLRLDDAAVKRITATPPDNSKFWLVPGDMLIQRANSLEYVGATAIFDGPEKTYIYPDLMMKVRVGDPMTRTYLWLFLNSDVARGYFKANATGTAGSMPKINGKVLKATPVPIFTKEEQAEIVRRIESAFGWLDRMAADHTAAVRLLPKLDAAILAKAFRGELVPQDPNDEPASVLLERIKAEREAAPKTTRGRRPTVTNISGKTSIKFTATGTLTDAPKKSGVKSMTKSRQDDDVKDKPYLAALLKSAPRSDVQSLFRAADLPVADFYKQLAWEIDKGHILDSAEDLKAA